MKKVISIEGMKCVHCAAKVKKALEALGEQCEVDLEMKQATLITEAADSELKEAVEAKGFTVTGIKG